MSGPDAPAGLKQYGLPRLFTDLFRKTQTRNRAAEDAQEVVTIAGKCCESGDIIIKDIALPRAKRGDLLAVFTTGAYCYSMASNYNRNAVPPVVFVRGGKSGYAIRPQTYEDIARLDEIPQTE